MINVPTGYNTDTYFSNRCKNIIHTFIVEDIFCLITEDANQVR